MYRAKQNKLETIEVGPQIQEADRHRYRSAHAARAHMLAAYMCHHGHLNQIMLEAPGPGVGGDGGAGGSSGTIYASSQTTPGPLGSWAAASGAST